MRQVTIKEMSVGNVGAQFWRRVKNEEDFRADFKTMSKAPLWSDEAKFKGTVWAWMCEGQRDWTVDTTNKIMSREGGKMVRVQVDVGDRKDTINWGDVATIVKTRGSVDVVYIEVKDFNNPMEEDAMALLSHCSRLQGGVKIILFGSDEAMDIMQNRVLPRITESSSMLAGYKYRRIDVFMPRDDELGVKATGLLSVHRIALLLSLTTIKPSVGYICSLLPWSPVFVRFFVSLFELTGSILNNLSVPVPSERAGFFQHHTILMA